MGDFHDETVLDEMERNSLQKIISEVEAALAGSTPASRGVLENFLENAKVRVAALEKKFADARTERETRSREQLAIAHAADREANLSEREKATFSAFLKREFFTKEDFGRLEQFYTQTWDRLSESGKDEMSHRIWKGIRRDEYTFTELPKVVCEKETERAYGRLRDSAIGAGDAARIPAKDREEFIRAYERGQHETAEKILERECFKDGMFRGAESKGIKHAGVEVGRDEERRMVGREIAAGGIAPESVQKARTDGNKSNLDLSDLNLCGLKLADGSKDVSSTNLPKAVAKTVKSSPSLGDG